MKPELTFELQLHSAEIQRTHADICAVYGSKQTLYRWFKTLSAGMESVKMHNHKSGCLFRKR